MALQQQQPKDHGGNVAPMRSGRPWGSSVTLDTREPHYTVRVETLNKSVVPARPGLEQTSIEIGGTRRASSSNRQQRSPAYSLTLLAATVRLVDESEAFGMPFYPSDTS